MVPLLCTQNELYLAPGGRKSGEITPETSPPNSTLLEDTQIRTQERRSPNVEATVPGFEY